MALKTINQTQFVRGLNAMVGLLSQPKGSVPQMSNMWMSRRGSLSTVHGSQVLASPNAGVNAQCIYDSIAIPWLVSGTGPPVLGTLGAFMLVELVGTTPEQTALVEAKSNYTVLATLPQTPVRAGGNLLISLSPSGVLDYSLANSGFDEAANTIGPLPRMVGFNSALILALGNTYAPQQFLGTYTPTPLANNFNNAYPVWVASTFYPAGSQVVPTPANGHFYVAQQSGTSGTTQPAFPTVTGGKVSDIPPSSALGIIWKESGPVALPAPRGAAHAINHGACLFLWNTSPNPTSDGLDGPSVLAQSDVSNQNSWNPVLRTTIGGDDGQTGMGMSSFTISEAGIAPQLWLIIFKEFSTYAMQGLMPNAVITRVETDLGCIAPRSIQFVPGFGVVRLTHQGFAVTDGINDKLFSDPIRPYLFTQQDSINQGIHSADKLTWTLAHSFQTKNPPMYVCALPTSTTPVPVPSSVPLQFNRLACYDVELSAWTMMDLPFNIYGMNRIQTAAGMIYDFSVMGGQTDGILRDCAGMAKNWDIASAYTRGWPENASSDRAVTPMGAFSNAPIAWNVTLPEVFPDGTGRMFYQDILVRGSTLDSAVSISSQLFGENQSQPVYPVQTWTFSVPGDFELRVPIAQTHTSMHVVLSGQGRVTIESVKWNVAPLEARVPASLMVG